MKTSRIFKKILAHSKSKNWADSVVYIPVALHAGIIREVLKQHFPKAKFKVWSKIYSGGSSIRVRWIGGDKPDGQAVNQLLSKYQGAGYSGMDDLKFVYSHWLKPDLTVELRTQSYSPTFGSLDNRDNPPADAIPVKFGGNFVFYS